MTEHPWVLLALVTWGALSIALTPGQVGAHRPPITPAGGMLIIAVQLLQIVGLLLVGGVL